jgi:hypothetical protein
VAVAAAGFVLLPAAPASAHNGNSPAADNFSGSVTSVRPALPAGISIEIIEFGNRLRLTNTSGEVVSVPGYTGEPYLQIASDGVRRNENSPATYLNVTADATTALPEYADPLAEPSWVTVSSAPMYEWHDHRTHWMSPLLPPEVLADPGSQHRVIEWTIPLEIDGQTYEVEGVLDWTPPPAGWVSYLALFVLGVISLVAGWIRRSLPLAAGLLIFACAGSVWHAVSTLLGQGRPSSVVYGLFSVAVPTLLVLVLTAFAVRIARRQSGPDSEGGATANAVYPMAIVSWLLVVQGLPELDVLFQANVSAAGPVWAARLAVLLMLGLGLGLAGASMGLLRTSAGGRDHATRDPSDVAFG